MVKIILKNESGAKISLEIFAVILRNFQKVLKKKVYDFLGNQNGEIGLILVKDAAIQKLNREYRNIDRPTDVLSFAYMEGDWPYLKERKTHSPCSCVGDMFISVETAKRQAKEHGHPLEKELRILFTHGLLHLFGFDHNTDEEEREMEKWAKKILAL